MVSMRTGGWIGRCGKLVAVMFPVMVILAFSCNCANAYAASNGAAKTPGGQGITSPSKQTGPARDVPLRQAAPIKRAYTVEDGDSFFEILKENGLSGEDAIAVIKKTRPVFNTSKIKPGNEMLFVYSPIDQNLVEINYDISDLKRLVISISGDRISARRVDMEKEEHVISSTDSVPIPHDRFAAQPIKPTYAPRTQVQGQGAKGISSTPGQRQIDIKVKRGHTLSTILGSFGVENAEVQSIIRSARGEYNLRMLKQGRTLSVWLSQDKASAIQRLTYEMDDTRYLDVSRHHGSFLARTRALSMDVRYESAQGRIRSSLYDSAIAEGIKPEIVNKLTDVFEHDINFFSDIQPGDTYSVLFEKYYVKDQFKGYGRIVAARFVNRGEVHSAFYYACKDKGIQGYYDEKGNPLKKMFLQAPLNYRRISSGFSYHRTHPIFGVVRPHLGIDYAAPMGTPVRSLGPGKIIKVGWDGGLGKAVRVKHPGGYISIYGHLSRFPKGIAVGKNVDQGDTIAYVGMTGNTTGPHLHFMISSNNKYINPLKMRNVNGPALGGAARAEFRHIKGHRMAMLENRGRNIALSHHDSNSARL